MAQLSVKSKVLHAIENLPQDVTYEQVMEQLYFLYKVEQGLQEAAEGKTISHEELERSLKRMSPEQDDRASDASRPNWRLPCH